MCAGLACSPCSPWLPGLAGSQPGCSPWPIGPHPDVGLEPLLGQRHRLVHRGDQLQRLVVVRGRAPQVDAGPVLLGLLDRVQQVLVAADQDHVGDRAFAGQAGEVGVQEGVDALLLVLAVVAPDQLAQAQLEPVQHAQQALVAGRAGGRGGVVPVHAQDRQAGLGGRALGQRGHQPRVIDLDPGSAGITAHHVRGGGQHISGVDQHGTAIHWVKVSHARGRWQHDRPAVARLYRISPLTAESASWEHTGERWPSSWRVADQRGISQEYALPRSRRRRCRGARAAAPWRRRALRRRPRSRPARRRSPGRLRCRTPRPPRPPRPPSATLDRHGSADRHREADSHLGHRVRAAAQPRARRRRLDPAGPTGELRTGRPGGEPRQVGDGDLAERRTGRARR